MSRVIILLKIFQSIVLNIGTHKMLMESMIQILKQVSILQFLEVEVINH